MSRACRAQYRMFVNYEPQSQAVISFEYLAVRLTRLMSEARSGGASLRAARRAGYELPQPLE